MPPISLSDIFLQLIFCEKVISKFGSGCFFTAAGSAGLSVLGPEE